MQLESKDIYNLTSRDYTLDFDLVKSVGDAVFKSLSDLQRDPPNLILDVRGLGRRFVRYKKTLEKYDKHLFDVRDLHAGTLRFRTPEDVQESDKLYTKILALYEKYLAEKQRIKTIRREIEALTQPAVQTQQLSEPSEDNQGECERVPPGEYAELRLQDQLPESPTTH